MSREELKPIREAFEQIDAARQEFIAEMSALLGELEQLCCHVQTRAEWVEQRQQQIDEADTRWFDQLQTLVDQNSGGSSDHVAELIESLSERLEVRAEAEIEAHKVDEIKRQNGRLAAELKLARTRAAQLSRTVESQQQIIDRDHAMSSELALLRQTLNTHRQLLGALDQEDESFTDEVLDEALSEFDS